MKLIAEAEAQNEYMTSDQSINLVTFDQIKHNKNAQVQYKDKEGELHD